MEIHFDFPPIFKPFIQDHKKWDGIKCQIGTNKFYQYTIEALGPFFFLSRTSFFKSSQNFLIFLQNYIIKDIPDKRTLILYVNSSTKQIPSITLILNSDSKFCEICKYFLSLKKKINDLFLHPQKCEGIYSLDFEVYKDGMQKPVKSMVNLFIRCEKWIIQIIDYDEQAGILTTECTKDNISIYPCVENPEKFREPQKIMQFFFLDVKTEKNLIYIDAKDTQTMINWILITYYIMNLNSGNIDNNNNASVNISNNNNNYNDNNNDNNNNNIIIDSGNSNITINNDNNHKNNNDDYEENTDNSVNSDLDGLSIFYNSFRNDDENLFTLHTSNDSDNSHSLTLSNDSNSTRSFGSIKKNAMHKDINTVRLQKRNLINENDDYVIPNNQKELILEQISYQKEKYSNKIHNIFQPPKYKEIIDTSIVSLSGKENKSLLLQSLFNVLNDDINRNNQDFIDFQFNFQSVEDIAQSSLDEMIKEENFDLTIFFPFSEYPEYDINLLKNAKKPQNEFIDLFNSLVVDLHSCSCDQPLNMNQNNVLSLCYLVGCIIVNGLRKFIDTSSKVSIVSLFRELSNSFKIIADEIEKSDCQKTCQQASIAASLMLKNKLFYPFLYEVSHSNGWSSKYYLPSAMLSNNDFIADLIRTIESTNDTTNNAKCSLSIFENLNFDIQITSKIFKTKLEDKFYRFAFTPLFAYLEIDDLFDPLKQNKVEIISRQFEVGLIKKKPWDIIEKLSQEQRIPISLNSNSSSENFKKSVISHKKTKKIAKISELSQITHIFKQSLDEWISEELESKSIHIYFILIHVNLIILNMDNYYSDSSLMDPFKVSYIAKKLYKYVSQNY